MSILDQPALTREGIARELRRDRINAELEKPGVKLSSPWVQCIKHGTDLGKIDRSLAKAENKLGLPPITIEHKKVGELFFADSHARRMAKRKRTGPRPSVTIDMTGLPPATVEVVYDEKAGELEQIAA